MKQTTNINFTVLSKLHFSGPQPDFHVGRFLKLDLFSQVGVFQNLQNPLEYGPAFKINLQTTWSGLNSHMFCKKN